MAVKLLSAEERNPGVSGSIPDGPAYKTNKKLKQSNSYRIKK